MPKERVLFSNHATARLFEYDLSRPQIERALREGDVIDRYPEDSPFPSYLVLSRLADDRPVHVVASDDERNHVTWVITTYVPDPDRWDETFSTRLDDTDE